MTVSKISHNIDLLLSNLTGWGQRNFLDPDGWMQIGAILVSYLIAWAVARQIRRYLEKDSAKAADHLHYKLNPHHFSIMLKLFFWLVLVWFAHQLYKKSNLPVELLHMTIVLIVALLVIRLASFYFESTFWSRFAYVVCLVVVSLRIFNLWDPTVRLLNDMTIELGKIRISIWNLIEATVIFILLWAAAGVARRFVAQWLTTSTRLTYSDRTLLLRVINAATAALVILISLSAAGIHLGAIMVTGGAIGFAIGIGLQKIGSNLVSGIVLLVRKPIRQGDVIAFEKGFSGVSWGWITRVGLNYVQVATRGGTSLLVPNEVFITQKIENLSYDDSLVRLEIPVGIAYASDLNEATSLAVSAAMGIARVLKVPEPKCLVREFGDSAVNLTVRVWINDPKNGISNLKDAVFRAIWDSFKANGISIPFPQRDLYLKSAVPLDTTGT